jgi:hypothetical protein
MAVCAIAQPGALPDLVNVKLDGIWHWGGSVEERKVPVVSVDSDF